MITFESFLSGAPAGKYVYQDTPYEEQIARAAQLLRDAEYVLLGVGAGMSTAAGAQYGGDFFRENFGQFRQKYGENNPYWQDMYSAGFYPFPDEESFWGYWSKHAILGSLQLDVTPLHRQLLEMLEGKKLFCLSTNVDGQFEKAGLPAEQIFCTQGAYTQIQCAEGCHPEVYNAAELFLRMDACRRDCRIPSRMVPKCPVCGGKMAMHLRSDEYFVQDRDWYAAEERFSQFLSEAVNGKLVLLELGVGFNTPAIIRFPFDRLTANSENISLIRLNLNQAVIPKGLGSRAVGINADMAQSIRDISDALRSSVRKEPQP